MNLELKPRVSFRRNINILYTEGGETASYNRCRGLPFLRASGCNSRKLMLGMSTLLFSYRTSFKQEKVSQDFDHSFGPCTGVRIGFHLCRQCGSRSWAVLQVCRNHILVLLDIEIVGCSGVKLNFNPKGKDDAVEQICEDFNSIYVVSCSVEPPANLLVDSCSQEPFQVSVFPLSHLMFVKRSFTNVMMPQSCPACKSWRNLPGAGY